MGDKEDDEILMLEEGSAEDVVDVNSSKVDGLEHKPGAPGLNVYLKRICFR